MNKEQLEYIFDQIAYKPSPEQWEIHLDNNRIREVAGGERSGKSKSSACDLVGRMFEGKLYWLVAADYERTRAEYDYIIEALVKLGINFDATKKIDPGEITTELGITIQTKSSKDPRKIAMTAPDGILACEASQLDFETFLRLRGRLAETRGWLLMSGTFESSLGWYVDLYNLGQTPNDMELVSFSMPTWSNLAVFPGGRTDPEIQTLEKMMPADWFMERYGGIPCPPKGLVFPEFRSHIHTGSDERFKFDPSAPVYIWVDPGYAHVYAVLFAQKRGDGVVVFDEVYERGFVTEDILTICQQKPWWGKAQIVGGAIDIAGTQHQAMSSPQEVWATRRDDIGWPGISLQAQKINIRDGIERVKTSLKVNPITNLPGLFINANCKGLISEFGGCPSPIDSITRVYKWRLDRDGNVVGDVPDDKNNDAVKALTYGLVNLLGFTPKQVVPIQVFKRQHTRIR